MMGMGLGGRSRKVDGKREDCGYVWLYFLGGYSIFVTVFFSRWVGRREI